MTTLQRKRDDFRKQIRRTEIERIQAARRKQFMKYEQETLMTPQLEALMRIFSTLEELLRKNQTETEALQVKELLFNLESICQKHPSVCTVFIRKYSEVPQCSQMEQDLMVHESSQARSAANRIGSILRMLIDNREESSEEDEDQPIEPPKAMFSQQAREYILFELLKFLELLQYDLIDGIEQSDFRSILGPLWELFGEREILYSKRESFKFLVKFLTVLQNIVVLNDRSYIVQFCLERSLGTQVYNIIDFIKDLSASVETHRKLLQLLNRAACMEVKRKKQQEADSQEEKYLNSMVLNNIDTGEKQLMLAYCLNFIHIKEELLYDVAMGAIRSLCELNPYLTSCIQKEHLRMILALLLHPNRSTQTEAVALVNDLAFHSQEVSDFLMNPVIKENDSFQSENSMHKHYHPSQKKRFTSQQYMTKELPNPKNYVKDPELCLYDLLYQRLKLEKVTADGDSPENIKCISDILCNSLLTEDRNLIKLAQGHALWSEIVYENFHPSSKLFPLIITFEYFLSGQNRKKFPNFLRPYFLALQDFEWKSCRFATEIENSIKNVFQRAKTYWEGPDYEKLLQIYSEFNMLQYVDNFIEEGDMEEMEEMSSVKRQGFHSQQQEI